MLKLLLISVTVVIAGASDVNWGKKVPCFVVEETVVCPGCNYRAGLSCPRSLKNSRNCLEPSPESPYSPPHSEEPTVQEKSEEPTVQEKYSTDTYATETTLPTSTESPLSNEINRTATRPALTLEDFLFLVMRNRTQRPLLHRQSREAMPAERNEDDDQVCDWNGDCPCPQICCKTGPGCPKKCVMGIRLPPPWG